MAGQAGADVVPLHEIMVPDGDASLHKMTVPDKDASLHAQEDTPKRKDTRRFYFQLDDLLSVHQEMSHHMRVLKTKHMLNTLTRTTRALTT